MGAEGWAAEMLNHGSAVRYVGGGSEVMKLDEKGRCCGRKPMTYRRYASGGPQRYCPRCDRAYDLEENEQIANWAWKLIGVEWVRQTGTGSATTRGSR
jgi:hypothetical protein